MLGFVLQYRHVCFDMCLICLATTYLKPRLLDFLQSLLIPLVVCLMDKSFTGQGHGCIYAGRVGYLATPVMLEASYTIEYSEVAG